MNNICEIEKNLIGAILVNEDRYQDVSPIVSADDFANDKAKRAYLAISSMYGREPINLQTLYMRVNDKDKDWVLSSSEQIVSTSAKAYAKIISDDARKRRISEKCKKVINEIKSNNLITADDAISDLLKIYKEELGSDTKKYGISSVLERCEKEVAYNRENGLGIPTGYRGLDSDFIYYRPGHLWVIGAWTSVGKSAWMIDAVNRAKKAKIAIFSTEMMEGTNVARILANKTGLGANVIISGKALDIHNRCIQESTAELAKHNLKIVDDIRNVDHIATQSRKFKNGGGLDLIYIDFIQNLHKPGHKSKYEMMSQIAVDLQNLAHDLKCTVICMSQLPTSAAKDDSGILEFKGAGEIAAACDVGVLMQRSKEDKAVVNFDIRKNRHGKCKNVLLKFIDWVRFEEL